MDMMKKFYISILLMVCSAFATVLYAQDIKMPQSLNGTMNQSDSLASFIPATVDSTLVGRTVMDIIASSGMNVEVNRSYEVDRAFDKYIRNNKEKKINGYRIRIFFDNKQTARNQSEEIEKQFIESFPQYPVYRTYTNPYFKVAVGDCRSKSDAVKLLKEIQGVFPNAFVIRDVINYPL